uniref:PUB domain-containing protein n=1 Tax=Macrostomum lignano TaxID=282301 RepID=A0A1I8JMN3_9PLAT
MLRKIIATTSAPAAVGPLPSQPGSLGQLCTCLVRSASTCHHADGRPDVESQAEQVLINMAAVLKAALRHEQGGEDHGAAGRYERLCQVNAHLRQAFQRAIPSQGLLPGSWLAQAGPWLEIEAVAARWRRLRQTT